MNIKQTFIDLTSKTYPYGHEEELTGFLPYGYKNDEDGNYYYEVGTGSKTIFACHLDTASKGYQKVKHVFDGKFIRTNRDTILGADDKAGVTLLLYMIHHSVPGLYYFFVGEEVGCIGSTAASKRVDFFSKYNRIVSFDRRDTTSIITHQSSRRTCSDGFANALSKEYGKHNLDLSKDDTGVYTDSAEFSSVIPECTNISVGYYKEHTHDEYQNIEFLERLCKASVLIDWENLPVERDKSKSEWKEYKYDNYNYYGGAASWGSGYGRSTYYGGTTSRKKTRRGGKKSTWDYDDDDYFGNKYVEPKPKVYLNDLEHELTDEHLIINHDSNTKDYYKGVKKLFFDDNLTPEEFKIIKSQCLNMIDDSDREFCRAMEDAIKEDYLV